jgi:hypothetical protein
LGNRAAMPSIGAASRRCQIAMRSWALLHREGESIMHCLRCLPVFAAAVLTLQFLPRPVHAQSTPLYWVGPVNVEEGLPIATSTPVGSITVGCALDNFGNDIDWGDHTNGTLKSPGSSYTVTLGGQQVTLVGPGTYSLYAPDDKKYGPATSGAPPLTAKITSTLHCYGATETKHWSVAAEIRVYPHTPLKELNVAPGTRADAASFSALKENPPLRPAGTVSIKGGTKFILTVISTDRAPPSNAYVGLAWSGTGAALVISAASSLEIPVGLFTASATFDTQKTASKKAVTVTANSGVGNPVHLSFEITP